MAAPIAFVDTETTGLGLDADIWEVAIIRRDPGKPDDLIRLLVEHDQENAARLPERFRADHDARYDPKIAVTRGRAAGIIDYMLRPGDAGAKCHIVGAVPNFDTERIARLLAAFYIQPSWHHHLIDVENLAVGWLAARGEHVVPPWSSDEVSRRIGVEPPTEGRHTAMGDAEWARAIYDRIVGGMS